MKLRFTWLTFLRLFCLVMALLVLCSGLIAVSMGKPAPLTIWQRLAIALPLLAIFNYTTTYLKKKAAEHK
ncbi:MAG: hypothetical protein EOP04_11630 [Proteobacteria bacterium]|nr:MAG: hypothetical protein EOP04_11630 [Pseudomonadota bacterium]